MYLVERLALFLGLGAVDLMAAAHRVDRGLERLLRQTVLARKPSQFILVVSHREQEHLARNETVAAPLRFLVGSVQQGIQFTADLHLAIAALHLRQPLDQAVERLRQRRRR